MIIIRANSPARDVRPPEPPPLCVPDICPAGYSSRRNARKGLQRHADRNGMPRSDFELRCYADKRWRFLERE
jgi:hypothetical protein